MVDELSHPALQPRLKANTAGSGWFRRLIEPNRLTAAVKSDENTT
jgi:hypothetical protein